MRVLFLCGTALCLAACQTVSKSVAEPKTLTDPVTTQTSDGLTIFATPYFGTLGPDTPLILLFHQGGSNGRGEYEPLAGWLNESGYRALAWDQRQGGERLGSENRTVKALVPDVQYTYCDATPDLQAALDFTTDNDLAEDIIVWGSSYSAALIFELAANNPETVDGVIAFSPASGGPMVDCLARQWVPDLKAPALALRPGSEMERESAQAQRDIFLAAGIGVEVFENGIHGSSMLVDERTEADMTDARAVVMDWLNSVAGARP